MSTYTENYNLVMPAAEDYYDVEDFNGNMETIDGVMAATEEEIAGVSDKIGASSDEDTATVFGKLNDISDALAQGSSPIKSIQHIVVDMPHSTNSVTGNINAVVPSRCVVIMERLRDLSDSGCALMTYTLNSTSIVLSNSTNSNRTFGFWIIEFY